MGENKLKQLQELYDKIDTVICDVSIVATEQTDWETQADLDIIKDDLLKARTKLYRLKGRCKC